MRGVGLFLFIVTLPALAALGHDAYLYYINQPKPFDLAALGGTPDGLDREQCSNDAGFRKGARRGLAAGGRTL